jgi:hypothetical protein
MNQQSIGTFHTFDDLLKVFGCSICRDVLAAPVSLSCGHSFCGTCFKALKDSCITSNDIDLIPTCPLDRKPVSNAIYDRVMDDLICEEVSKLSDSKDKFNWISKRQKYLQVINDPRAISTVFHEDFGNVLEEINYPMAVFTTVSLVLIAIARSNSSS